MPENYLDRLRAAGLLLSGPFVPDHVAHPDGVTIGKPASVWGNALPQFEGYFGANDGFVDAPCFCLHSEGTRWVVTSWDCIPGPGPGDFVNKWPAPEEAIADVLDFYFGDPGRMNAKRHLSFKQARSKLS